MKCTTIRFNWQPSVDKDYAPHFEEIHVGMGGCERIIDENEMPRPYYEVVYTNGSRERYYNVYYAAFAPDEPVSNVHPAFDDILNSIKPS